MVVVGTGKSGTRFIRTEYPVEEGITAGTTKLRDESALIAEEESLVLDRDKIGVR